MNAKTVAAALSGLLCMTGCAQQQAVQKTSAQAVSSTQVAPPVAGYESMSESTVSAAGQAIAPMTVQVPEAIFCLAVKDRMPQGQSEVFPPDVKKVFFFNRVTGAARPTAVTHVWYWQEKQMAEVPLDVRSDNWRTWSSKRIEPAWKGSWAVKVLDENGDVVVTKNFRIE